MLWRVMSPICRRQRLVLDAEHTPPASPCSCSATTSVARPIDKCLDRYARFGSDSLPDRPDRTPLIEATQIVPETPAPMGYRPVGSIPPRDNEDRPTRSLPRPWPGPHQEISDRLSRRGRRRPDLWRCYSLADQASRG